MRRPLLAIAVLVTLSYALPATACEKCSLWYDAQAQRYCKECVYAYCGYYGCTVEQDSDGWEWCDSAWDVDGSDQCFTTEGIAKRWCHPDEKDPVGDLMMAPEVEWKLVRARVVPRVSPADRRHSS